jgi:hypothetical protein
MQHRANPSTSLSPSEAAQLLNVPAACRDTLKVGKTVRKRAQSRKECVSLRAEPGLVVNKMIMLGKQRSPSIIGII